MQMLPDKWHHRTDELRHTTITWEEACIVVFVASALQQQKSLAPRTISPYLSGVPKYLENEGDDTRFMNKSQYMRNTKQGLSQYYRAHTTNQTTGDRERMPVTAEVLRPACSQSHYCPTSSQYRNVDWLHGRGPRIGIPPDPERNTFAYHRSRSV